VRVLSRLFRRLFLEAVKKAFAANQLRFFGPLSHLTKAPAFHRYLAPLRKAEWVVYAKPPFGGAQHALQYLGRYTHRTAISNERILAVPQGQVAFQWKDYRSKTRHRSRRMTLAAEEFIRRFLLHTLPAGFRRIRYFGFLASRNRNRSLAQCRRLLATEIASLLPSVPSGCPTPAPAEVRCPHCGTGILLRVAFVGAFRWPATPPDSS
jgi:hypothetical protein